MGISEITIHTDQLGREVKINGVPERIISLVPSQTEFLWDIGLNTEIVGITKFCVHPDVLFQTKTRVGGTKNLDLGKIKKLKPDLIICNKEENQKEQIEFLMEYYTVWVSDINTLDDAFDMMQKLGKITQKEEASLALITQIRQQFELLAVEESKSHKVAYFIWKDPYMVSGSNNFIDFMLEKCGLVNVFKNHELRYPSITFKELANLGVDLIFLSSEPFPFADKHIKEFELEFVNAKVRIVDGEFFSWYGSRLALAPKYLNDLLKSI